EPDAGEHLAPIDGAEGAFVVFAHLVSPPIACGARSQTLFPGLSVWRSITAAASGGHDEGLAGLDAVSLAARDSLLDAVVAHGEEAWRSDAAALDAPGAELTVSLLHAALDIERLRGNVAELGADAAAAAMAA